MSAPTRQAGQQLSGGRPLVVYADAHLFPPIADDRRAATEAGYELIPVAGHLPSDFRPYGAEAVGILAWGGRYDADVFDALPRLKVLARCGAGYENIDMAAAGRRGIALAYAPGASDHEVAEHTVALLLGAARKVTSSDRAIRVGDWPSSADLAPMRRVHGSTLGLVGFGRIARAVASKSQALGLQVMAYDPYIDPSVFTETGVQPVHHLSDLLASVDFVSLHVPGGADHAPLIGAAELAAMRSTTVLINTARGSLVDTDALVTALLEGRIAAAALVSRVGSDLTVAVRENGLCRSLPRWYCVLVTNRS